MKPERDLIELVIIGVVLEVMIWLSGVVVLWIVR